MEPSAPDTGDETVERLLEEGLDLGRAGQHQEALARFDDVLKRDPENARALRGRAVIHVRAGALSLAMSDLKQAVELRPDCADCWYDLGKVNMIAGRFDEALDQFGRCLSIDPEYASAYSDRAGIAQRLGRCQDAIEDITRALAIRPDDLRDMHNRAVVLASLGRQAEAIQEYELVLARDPASAGTLNNLAWLLATARDPALRDCRRAIDCARRAVAQIRVGAWLDTLAAAHAECGEFEQAMEIATEAYDISRPPNLAYKRRLEMYRRSIAYTSWLLERRASGLLSEEESES